MIRRIAGFVAAALVASTLVVGAAPAQATHQACVGQGEAHTSVRIGGVPDINNPTGAWSGTFSFAVGGLSVCVGGPISFSGNASGNGCAASTGSGGGVQFSTVGPIVVAQGAITGAGVILPDVTKGSECLVLGAEDFVIVGFEVSAG